MKTKKVKTVFIFPDECVRCNYQEQYGEGVCSICKTSNKINAAKVTITTTLDLE